MPRHVVIARPDVIVVGAGVVGAAVAYALTEAGLRVLVLDGGVPGAGVTASGMGHIVVMDDSPAQLALTSYSRSLFNELVPKLSPQCEVDGCGTLWLAEDEDQLEAVYAKRDVYASAGIDTEVLDTRAVAEAEPQLRAGLAGALRVPDDSVVYPPGLCRWLLDRAARNGACTIEPVRVERIDVLNGGMLAVVGGRTSHEAPIVVNAAGASAPALTPGLPILPRKGHLLITDRYPGYCHHQLVELGYLRSAHTLTSESVAFNVQPRRTGQLLIGSSRELVGWDASLNRDIVRRMLQRAIAFLPDIARLSVIRTWIGFRPATDDKLPLIGPFDGAPGLWIAAGHEGLGITTALGTGRLLADLLLDRKPAIDPVPYAAARAIAAVDA